MDFNTIKKFIYSINNTFNLNLTNISNFLLNYNYLFFNKFLEKSIYIYKNSLCKNFFIFNLYI